MKTISFVLPGIFLMASILTGTQAYATGTTCSETHATNIKVDFPSGGQQGESSLPVWSKDQVYPANSEVQLNNYEYVSRWWTQGNQPGGPLGEVWQAMAPGTSGMLQAWRSDQIYHQGEQTIYQSVLYTAKWWTKGSVPDGAGSAWAYVRTLDPFARVKLNGTYDSSSCLDSELNYYSVTNSVTVAWAIVQDPDKTISYWKQMDAGNEVARGTTKQGNATHTWTSSCTHDAYGRPVCTRSAQGGDLYLCSANDVCRAVLAAP